MCSVTIVPGPTKVQLCPAVTSYTAVITSLHFTQFLSNTHLVNISPTKKNKSVWSTFVAEIIEQTAFDSTDLPLISVCSECIFVSKLVLSLTAV